MTIYLTHGWTQLYSLSRTNIKVLDQERHDLPTPHPISPICPPIQPSLPFHSDFQSLILLHQPHQKPDTSSFPSRRMTSVLSSATTQCSIRIGTRRSSPPITLVTDSSPARL